MFKTIAHLAKHGNPATGLPMTVDDFVDYIRLHQDYIRRKTASDRAKGYTAAHRAVSRAIRKGTLVRPLVCSACGSSDNIQAHHYLGHAPEHWLDVEWLCFKCHNSRGEKHPPASDPA